MDVNNPSLYSMQLGLFVIGYKEARNEEAKKFTPFHTVLARYISLVLVIIDVSVVEIISVLKAH